MREDQVRICERLGVKFPGPTLQTRKCSLGVNVFRFTPESRHRFVKVGASSAGPPEIGVAYLIRREHCLLYLRSVETSAAQIAALHPHIRKHAV